MVGKDWVNSWGMHTGHIGERSEQQEGLRGREQCSKQDITEQRHVARAKNKLT